MALGLTRSVLLASASALVMAGTAHAQDAIVLDTITVTSTTATRTESAP